MGVVLMGTQMKYSEVVNTIKFTRDIIYRNLRDGDRAVDCTVGNGHDTLLLADIVGDSGRVYGFDIQDIAIETTFKKLESENLINRVNLIKDSHENIDKYIKESVDLVIYNLGYLPRGDKNIKTEKSSTIKSIQISLELLKNNGIILITCYTGHDGGSEEKDAIEDFLKKLNQSDFNVLKYDFINQKNFPPVLYCVEKTGGTKS